LNPDKLARDSWALKYHFISKYRYKFYIPMDELESISHEAMAKAINGFDPDKSAFSTFYGKIFKNMCISYLNKQSTRKRGDAELHFLEDMTFDSEGKTKRTWEETFAGKSPEPGEVIDNKDVIEKVLNYLDSKLNDMGKKVLYDYLINESADSAAEFGRKLGVTGSAITYQIRRIRHLANRWRLRMS